MDKIPSFGELSTYGPLGMAVLALGWYVLKQRVDMNDLTRSYIADIKAMGEVLSDNRKAMEAVATTSEARNRTSEAQARAQELAALAQTQVATELQRVREALEKSETEVRRLQEVVLQLGGAR